MKNTSRTSSYVKTHDVTATSTISGCSTKTASKSAGAIWWQQKWNNNLLLQSTTKSFPPRYPQYWQKWITSAGPATLLQEACIPEILCTWSPPSSGPLCTSTHLNRSKQHHQFAASHRSLRVHPHHSSNLWRNNSSEPNERHSTTTERYRLGPRVLLSLRREESNYIS